MCLVIDVCKGKFLVLGFRVLKSDKVVNVSYCLVLELELNELLLLLYELFEKLVGCVVIGYISLLKGYNGIGVMFCCIRVLLVDDWVLLVVFVEV